MAENRQMAGTCEKGKASVSDSWLAATGILGCSGKAGQTALCKACHRGFLARASHRDVCAHETRHLKSSLNTGGLWFLYP